MTKAYRIYGAEGHRQRESFAPSMKFTTWIGDQVEVRNSDKTGTNEYSEIWITSRSEAAIDGCLWGQIVDGIFENCRVGRIEEIA